jgi:hypothetical protein
MPLELVEAASNPTVTTDPSTTQYDDTFGRALNDFKKLMGQDHKLTNFKSPEAVSTVLSKTVQLFDDADFRAGNQSLKTWLESYVDLLFTVSATLWETTQTVSLTRDSLPSRPCYCTLMSPSHQPPSPENTICNAIVVLIEVPFSSKSSCAGPCSDHGS